MGFGLGVSPDQRAVEAKIDEELHGLVTQLTNEVTWHMRERGLTRADLAARMGVSPGRVSQAYTSGDAAQAEAVPASNQHSFPRAQHHQDTPRRR